MTRTAHIQLNRFQQCLHKFRRHDSTGSQTETQWELRCFIPSGWRSLIQRTSCYLLGKAGVKGEIERGHRSLPTHVRSKLVTINPQWRFLLVSTTSLLKPVLHRAALRKPTGHRPFPSFTNSHFQNEAQCKTFLVKMSVICMRLNIIFISMTSHVTSLGNRGLEPPGNGGMS